jgi:uncharacterized protein YegP (UPF0339 family)
MMKWELYEDAGGDWRWRLVAQNGLVMADSGEGYTRRRDCHRAIDRIEQEMHLRVALGRPTPRVEQRRRRGRRDRGVSQCH